MDYKEILSEIRQKYGVVPVQVTEKYDDEVYVDVQSDGFVAACKALHERLHSPVMMLFATDERATAHRFMLYCGFEGVECRKWFIVTLPIPEGIAAFDSLAKDIYSASLFEREIREMFGIEPLGNPDVRRLRLHDEVWPSGNFPLRKDFSFKEGEKGEYKFTKIEGEGVFEVPVGPVHAGIIGPGHFRFSVAGEPIINLEIRLGFTHRGAEKVFEGKNVYCAERLSECISGDSSFAHGMAFCRAVEKIGEIEVPRRARRLRAIYLELERMYNHVVDAGTIALDVGYSFPSAYASIIKETLLALNEQLTGSRYLKGVNTIGGVQKDIDADGQKLLLSTLDEVMKDFNELKELLGSKPSFMDRVDTTGRLEKRIAEDLGVTGIAGRASGIAGDLRRDFPGVYEDVRFSPAHHGTGDVLSRMNIRLEEFEESVHLIRQFAALLETGEICANKEPKRKEGMALGYAEGWRGPVLYWVQLDTAGKVDRCKIIDPSFRNWLGLAYAVLGNIVPDFPVCNKSFDLSYSGNDL